MISNSVVCTTSKCSWERNGSVVELLTRDREAAGLSLTGVAALWYLSKTHYPSLELVQPRKTRPCLTERLLMGRQIDLTSKGLDLPAHTHSLIRAFASRRIFNEC